MKDLENSMIGTEGLQSTGQVFYSPALYDREMKKFALDAAIKIVNSPTIDFTKFIEKGKEGDNNVIRLARELYEWLIKPDKV